MNCFLLVFSLHATHFGSLISFFPLTSILLIHHFCTNFLSAWNYCSPPLKMNWKSWNILNHDLLFFQLPWLSSFIAAASLWTSTPIFLCPCVHFPPELLRFPTTPPCWYPKAVVLRQWSGDFWGFGVKSQAAEVIYEELVEWEWISGPAQEVEKNNV